MALLTNQIFLLMESPITNVVSRKSGLGRCKWVARIRQWSFIGETPANQLQQPQRTTCVQDGWVHVLVHYGVEL